MMPDLPMLKDWEPLIGQNLTLEEPDFRETLTLTGTIADRHAPPPGLPHGFTLSFLGADPTVMLAQAIYRLHHPALGQISLFLACCGRQPDGRFIYQAIIN